LTKMDEDDLSKPVNSDVGKLKLLVQRQRLNFPKLFKDVYFADFRYFMGVSFLNFEFLLIVKIVGCVSI